MSYSVTVKTHVFICYCYCFLFVFIIVLYICARLVIISTAFLLKNFALVDDKINWILSILFSSLWPNRPNMTCLKSLYSAFDATTMAILFQISLLRVTVILNRFTKNRILVKMFVTNFSNLFCLLSFRYVRSS